MKILLKYPFNLGSDTIGVGLPTSIGTVHQVRLLTQVILICGKLPLKPTIIPLEVAWTQQELGWGLVPPSVFLLCSSTYNNPFSA